MLRLALGGINVAPGAPPCAAGTDSSSSDHTGVRALSFRALGRQAPRARLRGRRCRRRRRGRVLRLPADHVLEFQEVQDVPCGFLWLHELTWEERRSEHRRRAERTAKETRKARNEDRKAKEETAS